MTDATEATPVAAPPPGEEATPPPPDLGDRMKAFGEEIGARGQQFGREAQAAGERWSKDPVVIHVTDSASRVWGLLVLLVGLYFFVQVTLGFTLPAIPWADLWPIALIVLGLVVITRGLSRRS